MRALTVNTGLPQGLVSSLVQDKQGFIWLASDGLSRFDGRSFVNYRHIADDTASLAADEIRDMQIDDQGNLWIVYVYSKVDVMNTFTGRIRHLSAEPAFQWLKSWTPDPFSIRQVGGRYFAMNCTSIMTFDTATGKHAPIFLPANEKLLAESGNLNRPLFSTQKALYELKGNRLERLLYFPALPQQTARHWDSVIQPSQISVGKIIADRRSRLFLTAVDGLYLVDAQLHQAKYTGSLASSLKIPIIPVIGGDGHVYIVLRDGIHQLDDSLKDKLHYKNFKQFQFDGVLMADQSGLLWASIGTYGIRIFNVNPVRFYSYTYKTGFTLDAQEQFQIQNKKTQNNSYMLRLAKDTNEHVWVLTRPDINRHGRSIPWGNISLLGGATAIFSDTIYDSRLFTFDGRNQCWVINERAIWPPEYTLAKGRY